MFWVADAPLHVGFLPELGTTKKWISFDKVSPDGVERRQVPCSPQFMNEIDHRAVQMALEQVGITVVAWFIDWE